MSLKRKYNNNNKNKYNILFQKYYFNYKRTSKMLFIVNSDI